MQAFQNYFRKRIFPGSSKLTFRLKHPQPKMQLYNFRFFFAILLKRIQIFFLKLVLE